MASVNSSLLCSILQIKGQFMATISSSRKGHIQFELLTQLDIGSKAELGRGDVVNTIVERHVENRRLLWEGDAPKTTETNDLHKDLGVRLLVV
jgi:hypothetical protein